MDVWTTYPCYRDRRSSKVATTAVVRFPVVMNFPVSGTEPGQPGLQSEHAAANLNAPSEERHCMFLYYGIQTMLTCTGRQVKRMQDSAKTPEGSVNLSEAYKDMCTNGWYTRIVSEA